MNPNAVGRGSLPVMFLLGQKYTIKSIYKNDEMYVIKHQINRYNLKTIKQIPGRLFTEVIM